MVLGDPRGAPGNGGGLMGIKTEEELDREAKGTTES